MTGYVLDDTLIESFVHGSDDAARLIASLNARGIRMSVPTVPLAVVQAALSDDQCDEINGIVDRVEHVRLSGLETTEQATGLSRVIGGLGELSDLAAAHTISVAATLDWPIVTLDRSRWEQVHAQLPWSLELVELSEPSP